jgi:hypothetical protein
VIKLEPKGEIDLDPDGVIDPEPDNELDPLALNIERDGSVVEQDDLPCPLAFLAVESKAEVSNSRVPGRHFIPAFVYRCQDIAIIVMITSRAAAAFVVVVYMFIFHQYRPSKVGVLKCIVLIDNAFRTCICFSSGWYMGQCSSSNEFRDGWRDSW